MSAEPIPLPDVPDTSLDERLAAFDKHLDDVAERLDSIGRRLADLHEEERCAEGGAVTVAYMNVPKKTKNAV